MHYLFLLILVFLSPLNLNAAQFSYDASVSSGDIFFSKSPLIVGDSVRLYARVVNAGTNDITAYVRFFAGNTFVGDTQPVSIVAGGYPDEVYVDWIIPEKEFNIRAEIKTTNPQDENPSNNVAITSLFTPKKDSDNDGTTDDIDFDDDNDGLLDVDERNLGTDPLDRDTDSDGVLDGADAYPLDPLRSSLPPVTPEQPVTPSVPLGGTNTPTPTPSSGSWSITTSKQNSNISNSLIFTTPEEKKEEVIEDKSVINEPEQKEESLGGVIINREKINWRSYIFEPSIRGFASQNLEYRWEFGDGQVSDRRAPKHTFSSPGDYSIHLNKVYRADDVVVSISFFHLTNYQLWIFVVSLITGLILLIKLLKKIALRNFEENND